MEVPWWISLDGNFWHRIPSLLVTSLMDTVHPKPAASNERLAHNEMVFISIVDHCAAYIRLMRELAGSASPPTGHCASEYSPQYPQTVYNTTCFCIMHL